MTTRPPSPPEAANNEFSYRLTENLLSQRTPTPTGSRSSTIQTPLQQGIPRPKSSAPPKFIVTSPTNSAMVIQPKDSDSSFNQYIGNHFKQDAPVLLDRLHVTSPPPRPARHTPSPTNNHAHDEESTFWSYLSKDLEDVIGEGGHHQTSAGPGLKESSSKEYLNNSNKNRHSNTWYENDSIFTTTSDLIETNSPFFSMGAFLFLFGFICPPSWWVGSFYPTVPKDRMDSRWKLLNRFFSLGFSTLLVIALIVLAILYSKTK